LEDFVSATRLLVLGVVRMHGSAHGYQVRRELLSWSADKWANVAPGSIYHALKQMTKEGLLEQVDLDSAEAGPERTGYRLTGDGEDEFQMLLGKGLTDDPTDQASYFFLTAAITFITALPRKKAISLLRHRLIQLDGQCATVRDVLAEGTDWGQPAHIAELYRLWQATLEATMGWTNDLIQRLDQGEYVMADDDADHFGSSPVVIKLD
jgi:DNA-binding PadR family transcriptional regulator